MCGIGGALARTSEPVPKLEQALRAMNELQKHRGPDGEGTWRHARGHVGFAHRRLSVIDLELGAQPMTDEGGNWITYNGEIYNHIELREELDPKTFRTRSDTEVILRGYRKWGRDVVHHLRGMFAFALWDESSQELFCARDRFGIKPFYYITTSASLYFASEIKALLPFLERIETDLAGLKDYLAFQLCLGGKTLFRDVHELMPGHTLVAKQRTVSTSRYWDIYYKLDLDHTERYFRERLLDQLMESVRLHLRSDVPLGAYLSGGLDSSAVASLASELGAGDLLAFTGKFSIGPDYDESPHARLMARSRNLPLREVDITAADFVTNMRRVIYHLDQPLAGPSSFSQYMVSRVAARERKVVLGGQGGDEIFGGYARYLIAYFEQCIKAAINGTMNNGQFVVTYESIIPNLRSLENYKELLQEFWRDGLFDSMDRRYFRLVNRAPVLGDEINWKLLGEYSPYETFKSIFDGDNVVRASYFDRMTHFDFKTLLPALLHIEDRVSMAHGLEARVPLLDHPLVELVATMPANVKFKDGTLKHILREAIRKQLPPAILDRKDKMGFPTPFTEWLGGDAREFVQDVLSSPRALSRDIVNNRRVLESLSTEPRYGRKMWGLFCLELWQQEFHDREREFAKLVD